MGPPISHGGIGADFDGDGLGEVVTGADLEVFDDEGGSPQGPGVIVDFFPLDAEPFTQYFWFYPGPMNMSMAAGDINGDSFDELVVGNPRGEEPGDLAGGVWVLFGSENGVGVDGPNPATDPVEFVIQDDLPDANEGTETTDFFGASVAMGDIDHDALADMVIGAPGEGIGGQPGGSGSITVIFGNSAGLDLAGAQFLTQDSPGVPGAAEPGDEFGFAVAVGDATGDNRDDIVIGAPGENGVGGITLLKGSLAGIDPAGATGRSAVTSATVKPKRLGESLAIANLVTVDAFLAQEIIVGDPAATVSGKTTAGAVSVWIGRAAGLDNTGREWWHQNRANVPGEAETGDRFGTVLNAAPLFGDTSTELVVGVPNEDVGSLNSAGSITILTGTNSGTGLTGTGSRGYSQNTSGVPGGAEANDKFGSSLQTYFYLDELWLEVGASGEQVNSIPPPGSGSRTFFIRITDEDNESFEPGGSFTGEQYTVMDGADPFIVVRQLGLRSLQT
jgi:hypothetical protein